jgi:hypothetical protein
MNPLRSIIVPLLLLTAVVAIGVYYYRAIEGFNNYGDANGFDDYAPNAQWTRSIDASIRDCTEGVLVAQIREGFPERYYPVCFPEGTNCY